MGKRHNTLSDDIFRNSKYIKTLELEIGIDDFRKEYKEQYDIMLDVYKTLITLNNIFFADSNKNKKEKTNEILDTIEKAIYKSIDDDRAKYSVRTLKALIDSNTRLLYNKYNEWYESLSYNENYFDTLKSEIDEEMTKLESINFDNIVKGGIEYEKNKDSNYKIYISKFNNLYTDYKAFREQYKKDFLNTYGIDLTKEEMRYIVFIYDLIAYANNGIVKTLYDKEPIEFDLDERTSNEEFYKAYLTLLHIDIIDDNTFNANSEKFVKTLIVVSQRLTEQMPTEIVNAIDSTELLNRFDYYYFMVTMKDIIDGLIEVHFDNALINKITSDLKEIYELLVQEEYKGAFAKICPIIERNKNMFERLS